VINAQIDTLLYANELKAAGTPPAQAEALARLFGRVSRFDALATKVDLQALGESVRGEIKALEVSLRTDLASKADLHAQGDSIRAEIKALEARVAALEHRMIALAIGQRWMQWVLGLIAAGQTALLLKVFA
jgi:hypothetical protein